MDQVDLRMLQPAGNRRDGWKSDPGPATAGRRRWVAARYPIWRWAALGLCVAVLGAAACTASPRPRRNVARAEPRHPGGQAGVEAAQPKKEAKAAQAASSTGATPTERDPDPASGDSAGSITVAPAREPWEEKLLDPRAEASERLAAARTLAQSSGPDTQKLLVELLSPGGDPVVQRVIAQAVAQGGQAGEPRVASALFELLVGATPADADDFARAVAAVCDGPFVQRLLRLSLDASAPLDRRRAGIKTLGYLRRRDAAGALILLVGVDQPEVVRAEVFAALAALSGIEEIGRDAVRWRLWWKQRQDLSDEQWYATLAKDLAQRGDELAGQVKRIEERLTEVRRQLHRASPQSERTALLIDFLKDPSESTRLLAVELCVQRVIDAQAIEPELRDALLVRLEDPSAAVRRRAAKLLHDLSDEAAAGVAAENFVSGREQDRQVLGTYLLMLARRPQPRVVERALELLPDPVLGGQAAGVLAAAIDTGMVGAEQKVDAAARARARIEQDPLPDPKFVELLGRVGDERDWQRIAGWLDSEDGPVKQAAAKVWANSDQPLGPLVQRAADPVVQQIAIDAARRRGHQPQTMLELALHRPQEDQAVQAWQRAMVAMAGRVPPSAVLEVDGVLASRGESLKWREQLASAAIERLLPAGSNSRANGQTNSGAGEADRNPFCVAVEEDPAVLIDLLLLRAEVRLADGNPTQAVADFQRVAAVESPKTVEQQARYCRGVVRGSLAVGDLEGAAQAARLAIGSFPPQGLEGTGAAQDAVEAFLETAERSVAAGQLEQAGRVVAKLREVVGPSVPMVWAAKLAEIEARLGTVADQTAEQHEAASAEPSPEVSPALAELRPAPAAVEPAEGSTPVVGEEVEPADVSP